MDRNAALAVGGRLGPYEILAPIGAGAMGQVYRARDVKLNRDVALKILPETTALDGDRLARQQREARVLASLNHPNIAQIYGFEDSGTTHALVLELVDGRTLAERLQRGALPLPEALWVARQIADALEAAHDAGVIHRDLKPANVVMKDDGTVKVLDFGLAKSADLETVGAGASTMTSPAGTQIGLILGTAAYMSPEQARGMPVDKRTDIWAFGAVLYELLTGRRMFGGHSTTDVLAAVVTAEPDWRALPAATPPPIRRLLHRCVEKDVKKRLPHIGVARLDIDDALAAPAAEVAPSGSRRGTVTAWSIAAGVAALALVLWYSLRTPPEIHWTATQLTDAFLFAGCPRISPDGQFLAFCATVDSHSQAGVMNPDTGTWTILTHDSPRGWILDESWSRDSAKVYVTRYDGTHFSVTSIPVLGGDERLVLENAAFPQALPDGSLVFQRHNDQGRVQLHRFWPESARVAPLKALPQFMTGSPPFRVTPDGKYVVFFGAPADKPSAEDHLYAMRVDADACTRLALDFSFPLSGYLPMAASADSQSVLVPLPAGSVYRIVSVPLDGRRALRTVITVTNQIANFDVGHDGSLFLDQWDRSVENLRVSPDGGTPERIGTTFIYNGPAPDILPLPDGRLIMSSHVGGRDHLLLKSPGKDPSPFLDTAEETGTPMAAVGKTHVAFMVGTGLGRTVALASLSDRTISRRLAGPKGVAVTSMAASPDGRTLYYSAADAIWTISAEDGPPRRLRSGYSVAMHPNGEELIVRVKGANGNPELLRAPVAGGPDRPIVLDGNWGVAPVDFTATAVDRTGRLVTNVIPPGSFLWPLGVIDPVTGHVQVIRVGYDAKMTGTWDADGNVIVSAVAFHGSVWRFRPVSSDAK